MISAWVKIVYILRIVFLAVIFSCANIQNRIFALAQEGVANEEEPSLALSQSKDDKDADQDELESQEPDDVEAQEASKVDIDFLTKQLKGPRIVKNIIIEGAQSVPQGAILNKIPFRPGDVFDRNKTNSLIQKIYSLGFFKHIQLLGEDVGDEEINLIVVVKEKKLVEEIVFKGNHAITLKDIKKKIDISKIKAVDEEDLTQYVNVLRRMYREKDYHNVEIRSFLQENADHRIKVIFEIKEGKKSLIRRVFFKGNTYFTSKKLRSLIFTREAWLFGFLDRAGSYQPEAIEADKYVIENFYQSNGFINARVIDVQVDMDSSKENINITFSIQEGEQYRISSVSAPGNTLICEQDLLKQLPIVVGDLYSKDKVRLAIETLRSFWGEYGYINADIEPSIQPDEINKTVAITFYTELGSKVYVDKINIIGNEKTHDIVIRRQLTFQEGALLTVNKMEDSKNKVELLGFFDPRNGVNWRVNRVGNNRVVLDLIVREIKTGRVEFQMGFGGSQTDFSSPMESLNVKLGVQDSNLFGRGIQFNLSGEFSKEERNFLFNVTQPWLFDKPISAGLDLFSRKSRYNEFELLDDKDVLEAITGASFNVNFLTRKLLDSIVGIKWGVEGVTYENPPLASKQKGLTDEEIIELQRALDRRFASGNFVWLAGMISKDIRNHPLHPSRGYQWYSQSKVAGSTGNDAGTKGPAFGFFKIDCDASWYTPLIGERDLVFCLHGHLGIVVPYKNKSVPFRELYNVGGPASVRGFTFGEIGPTLINPSTPGKRTILGATKAFWLNAELAFPISRDFSMKGAVFYDGGAGWATPDASEIAPTRLKNNGFTYRHAIGFGIRLLRPTPVKVDWGFKLDPRRGESTNEIHFSAYHEF